jgi:hypothetical protein
MTHEEQIREFIDAIEVRVRQELRVRCEAYKPDFRAPEVFNVVTALLARQATLAIELASTPQSWNGHSAPLFLRAMTDVHITLSWILLDATTRARQYIDHGLGQAVLALEHRKKEMEHVTDDSKEKLEKIIAAEESWINAQKWSFLIDVNVGSWSGKTTRQMAEEAGILDFYNYVYTPFSQCAHSTWYHVGRYNSWPTESPLTRQLWMPYIRDASSDIWNLNLLAKYLDKSFNLFDEKALQRKPSSEIQEWLCDEIHSRFSSDDRGENASAVEGERLAPEPPPESEAE